MDPRIIDNSKISPLMRPNTHLWNIKSYDIKLIKRKSPLIFSD